MVIRNIAYKDLPRLHIPKKDKSAPEWYVAANNSIKALTQRVSKFMEMTDDYSTQGINPGGYYKAIWPRDASYILRDWFLAGRINEVMQELLFIWSHQIAQRGEKIIYGRGSPEMKYLSQVADPKVERSFKGALPSTIFHGFSEVYGRDPDIDSTALMVSTTAWILDIYLKAGLIHLPNGHTLEHKTGYTVSEPSIVTGYVIPRILNAVDYLLTRDIDGDGLLEQGHNEDWMDTALRCGKTVYSQACWILALTNLSSLLSEVGKTREAEKMAHLRNKTIRAVEERMWLENEGTYVDNQEENCGRDKRFTQDVSLYLVAVTENSTHDVLGMELKEHDDHEKKTHLPDFARRANLTLDSIKSRIWKYRMPVVTEFALDKTGPWKLDAYQYHNHTFWPWTTGIEMLARSRFDRFDECNALLSALNGDDSGKMPAFYECVHPITGKGEGAFPFRTGICAVRIAMADMLTRMEN